MTPIEIIARKQLLNSDRTNVEGIWTLIEQFVLPFRGEFYQTTNGEGSVNWRKRKIYDSTAANSCELLSASIHSNLTSLANRWFNLEFDEAELNEDTEARAWLDNAQEKLWKHIVKSNFDLKVGEFYLDLAGYGNGFMSLDIDENSNLIFDSIPISECVFEQDTDGKLLNFYRSTGYTPIQIIEKFGESEIANTKKKSAPAERLAVTFCVYKKKSAGKPDSSSKMSYEAMPYAYKWILDCDKSVLKEGVYYDMPFYFVPWRRTSNSVWGNGPATRNLSDILTLSELKEQILEGTAKAIDPPMFARARNIVGDIDLSRGGITVLKDMDGVKELNTNARLDYGANLVQDLKKSIQEGFHIDNLQLKESPAMTATEVQVRYEIMQKLLGPTLGRIQIHLLDPIIERIFYNMLRENKLGELPEVVSKGNVNVQYIGPLPRAQQFKEAQSIQEFLGITTELSAVYPEAKYIPNIEGTINKLAELKGINKSLLNSKEDIQAMVQSEQDQQNRMAEAEILKAQGGAQQQFAQANKLAQEI